MFGNNNGNRGWGFLSWNGFTKALVAYSRQLAWIPQENKLPGIKPDFEVARAIGRWIEEVSLKSQKFEIEAPLQPSETEDEIKLPRPRSCPPNWSRLGGHPNQTTPATN